MYVIISMSVKWYLGFHLDLYQGLIDNGKYVYENFLHHGSHIYLRIMSVHKYLCVHAI